MRDGGRVHIRNTHKKITWQSFRQTFCTADPLAASATFLYRPEHFLLSVFCHVSKSLMSKFCETNTWAGIHQALLSLVVLLNLVTQLNSATKSIFVFTKQTATKILVLNRFQLRRGGTASN